MGAESQCVLTTNPNLADRVPHPEIVQWMICSPNNNNNCLYEIEFKYALSLVWVFALQHCLTQIRGIQLA